MFLADFGNSVGRNMSYKLMYFNGRGRAELSRMIFAQAGVQYEDVRVEGAQWSQLKPSESCALKIFHFAR